MAEASWTRWSRLRVLRVKFDGASPGNEVIEEDWRDTWFLALGCSYRPNREWIFRSGVGYDQSPSRHRTRTPATPINNGILLSFGAGYTVTETLDLTFGYSHYFIDSARIDLALNLRATPPVGICRAPARTPSIRCPCSFAGRFSPDPRTAS